MTDTQALIANLRKYAPEGTKPTVAAIMDKAAATLAQNERDIAEITEIRIDQADEIERLTTALTDAEAKLAKAREGLGTLATEEKAYRLAHDLYGDGSSKAGRCWDNMRRAGDDARACLAELEEG